MRHVVPIVALCLLSGCNLFTSSSNHGNRTDTSSPNNGTPDIGGADGIDILDMGTSPDTDAPDMTTSPDMTGPDMPTSGDFGWDRSGRVQQNLLSYYTFEEGSGTEVQDRAPRGGTPPLILGPTATWVAGRNGAHVDGPERITGPLVAGEIWDWVVPREEITVEVWLKPENLTQSGPARAVTFSEDGAVRNFTIGQVEANWVLRFSANDREFSTNGTPELYAQTPATLAETHLAFTYDGLSLRFYVNGVLSSTSLRTGGLQHWDRGQVFQLGNENSTGRPWAGEFYMLAVYDRALTPVEVAQNFVEGSAR